MDNVQTKVVGSVRVRGRRKLVLYGCGHKFFRRFRLVIHGEVTLLTEYFWEKRPMCGPCALKDRGENVIQCGCCGRPIYVNDTVAVLPVDMKDVWPDYAVIVDGLGGKRVMACTRRGCAPGTAIDGTWTKQRFERFDDNMQRPSFSGLM